MGGRGASSSNGKSIVMGGKFSTTVGNTKFLDPGIFQNMMVSKSEEGAIETFKEKFSNADHVYYMVVNKRGTVLQYNEGGKDYVSGRFRDINKKYYQADSGSTDIHNHPKIGRIQSALPSNADLYSFARTDSITKSVITAGKRNTVFVKTQNFDRQGFLNNIANIKGTFTPRSLEKFYRVNADRYGYKFSSHLDKKYD